jgi:dipeptidase E
MGMIVAIGGGEISKFETLAIGDYIVNLTGKTNSKALFIPTASNESQGYIDIFNDIYGRKLGCKTDVLYLINGNLSDEEIKNKIFSADLIYVGGGDTIKMMEVWRSKKVDWWDYQLVNGLGLIEAIHCPHYNEEGREGFDEIMETFEGMGIAIENNCALVIKYDKFKILKSDEKSNAYKLYKLNGRVHKQLLDN